MKRTARPSAWQRRCRSEAERKLDQPSVAEQYAVVGACRA